MAKSDALVQISSEIQIFKFLELGVLLVAFSLLLRS